MSINIKGNVLLSIRNLIAFHTSVHHLELQTGTGKNIQFEISLDLFPSMEGTNLNNKLF